MVTMSLREYMKSNTQVAAAKQFGVTQGAIWQMLRSRRKIYVHVDDDGHAELREDKLLSTKGDGTVLLEKSSTDLRSDRSISSG